MQKLLAQAGECAARFWDVWMYTRVPALTVFIVGGLLFTDQGRDIAAGLKMSCEHALFFSLGHSLWVFHSWLWARRGVVRGSGRDDLPLLWGDQKDSERAKEMSFAERYCPRGIAFLALLSGVVLLFRADVGMVMFVKLLALPGLLFAFICFRKRINDSGKWGMEFQIFVSSLITGSLLVVMLVLVCAMFDSVWTGFLLGSGAVIFMAAAGIVGPLSWVTIRARTSKIPILVLLVIWMFLISGLIDPYPIRLADEVPAAGRRDNFEQALDHWSSFQPDQKCNQIVIFASAGGGILASYWTSGILARLEQEDDTGFSDKFFAISAVSGGAIGAGFHLSLLAHNRDPGQQSTKNLLKQQQALHELDYLAPTVLRGAFVDLLQLVLPFRAFHARDITFERSLERAPAYLDRPDDISLSAEAEPFRAQLSKLYSKKQDSRGWLPLVFLNGAHEEEGVRVISSQIAIEPDIFYRALDLPGLLKNDLYLSTAAYSAARFPLVAPPGEIRNKSHRKGHVLDGGYLENFGAMTAMDILKKAMELKPDLQPIIVQLHHDGDAGKDFFNATVTPAGSGGFRPFPDLLGPINGTYSNALPAAVHDAHGLKQKVEGMANGKYFYIPVTDIPLNRKDSLPLGWLLSKKSRCQMDEYLDNQIKKAHNGNAGPEDALAQLIILLKQGCNTAVTETKKEAS